MSQLDQAKREAARLFKIAKQNAKNNINQIEIKNLSQSQEYISILNGYKDWHTYQQELVKKDLLSGTVSEKKKLSEVKRAISNLDFYKRDIPFVFVENKKINLNSEYKIIEKKLHTPITLGKYSNSDKNNLFGLKHDFNNSNKEWLLDSYPLLVTGTTGSGKSYCTYSFANKYIENNEGVIYIDGRGDMSTFTKFYCSAKQHNRSNDFYFLNFMRRYNDKNGESAENEDKITHSIDLINPLIGNIDLFKCVFGDKVSDLIHSLCLNIKEKNGLVSIDNLNSFVILENLESFLLSDLFKNCSQEIINYLNEIEFYSDKEKALKKHAINFSYYQEILEILNLYKHLIKPNAEINLESIYYQKKILLISFPALEKSSEFLGKLLSVVLLPLKIAMNKLKNIPNTQNIILESVEYGMTKDLTNLFFKEPSPSANLIFSINQIPNVNSERYNIAYYNYATKNFNTHLILKGEEEVNDQIKIRIMDMLDNFPPFYKQSSTRKLEPGVGYIFGPNNKKLNSKKYINSDVKNKNKLSHIKIDYIDYYNVLGKDGEIRLNRTKLE